MHVCIFAYTYKEEAPRHVGISTDGLELASGGQEPPVTCGGRWSGSLTSLSDPWSQAGMAGSCLEGNRYLRQAGTPAAPRDTPAKPERCAQNAARLTGNVGELTLPPAPPPTRIGSHTSAPRASNHCKADKLWNCVLICISQEFQTIMVAPLPIALFLCKTSTVFT